MASLLTAHLPSLLWGENNGEGKAATNSNTGYIRLSYLRKQVSIGFLKKNS
jgi:hypothetical protein